MRSTNLLTYLLSSLLFSVVYPSHFHYGITLYCIVLYRVGQIKWGHTIYLTVILANLNRFSYNNTSLLVDLFKVCTCEISHKSDKSLLNYSNLIRGRLWSQIQCTVSTCLTWSILYICISSFMQRYTALSSYQETLNAANSYSIYYCAKPISVLSRFFISWHILWWWHLIEISDLHTSQHLQTSEARKLAPKIFRLIHGNIISNNIALVTHSIDKSMRNELIG